MAEETEEKGGPVEISPEEARQDAPARHAEKKRRAPGTLIAIYGGGLVLIALAIWAFLLLVRY
ncbi:MAG: hypothetical protein ACLFWF_01400, partial [Alphaproteobacteria bacterium]